MKEIRKILLILGSIFFILIGNISFAQSTVKDLSLEEAIERSIKESEVLNINKLNLENTRIKYEKARGQERKYRKAKHSSDIGDKMYYEFLSTDIQGFQIEEEVASKSVEYELLEAEMKNDYVKKNLESLVTKLYYGSLQAEKLMGIKEDTLENLKENHRIISRELELGTASKNDLYMAEIDLNTGIIELEKARDSYNDAIRNLNNVLNYPLDTKVNLTTDFLEKDVEINLDEDLKFAYENRYDYISARNTVDLAQRNFNAIARKNPSNTYSYREANTNLELTKYLLNNKNKEIEKDIKSKYDAIETAKKEMELMEANVNRAEEGLRLIKIQYELELTTINKVNEFLIQLDQARLGRANAITNYNTSLIDYEIAVRIGELGM